MHVVYVEDYSNDVDFGKCDIVNSFKFDDDMVFMVEATEEDCKHLEQQQGVWKVEEAFNAYPQWALDQISLNAASTATLEDTRTLHNVPEDGNMGEDVTVVVMDSGIDRSHRVFSNITVEEHDVTGSGGGDGIGHGTACAGQIARLAPKVDLISLRIFGNEGSTGTESIVSAYQWLFNNADSYDIVNMSWGASRPVDTIDRLHKKLLEKGVQDVVAAGNTGGASGSPATTTDAYSVGACTEDGSMARFSSYDPDMGNPELTAIGKDCRLAQASGTTMGQQLGGKWVKASGTSFAAPAVAGMIAKSGKPYDFAKTLVENSRPLENTQKEGSGLVDYGRAYDSDDDSGIVSETTAKVWEFAGRDTVYINKDFLSSGDHTARLRKDGVVEIHKG